MTTPWDPWIQIYTDFTGAIVTRNLQQLQHYVTADFVAVINGRRFNLEGFKAEILRLWEVFSDFGNEVDVHVVRPYEGSLWVLYDVAATFDGVLRSPNTDETYGPTYKKGNITGTDRYYFNEHNQIRLLEVNTNLHMIMHDFF